jgi:retron-type reverse transcriptase
MKRLANVWPKLCSIDNLYLAYSKARKAKNSRTDVAQFSLQLEHELLALQQQLLSGEYRPGAYRQFTLYERKPRRIAAAPFRDRMVHHAVMNIVQPEIDKRLIYDCYACRPNKGVHRAVKRYQTWSKRYRYALKLDIAAFFPSIDHTIMRQQLGCIIKDKPLLQLLSVIIDSVPETLATQAHYYPQDDLLTPLQHRTGLPIGNLTSQWFANYYLNGLDHFIKQDLGARAYLRYVDDMLLLSDSKQQLWQWRSQIEQYLAQLRLSLHPKKQKVFHVTKGVDVLGYRVFPDFCHLRNDNGHRFNRKMRRYAQLYYQQKLTLADIKPSLMSWLGHAQHADSDGLIKSIVSNRVFKRDSAIG